MRSLLSTIATCAVMASASEIQQGACPNVYNTNKRAASFDLKQLSGLWFEYLWDKGFDDNLDYKCSMWTVLETDVESDMVAYNYLHYGEDNNKFSKVEMHFPPLDHSNAVHFNYDRLGALESGSAPKKFNIVYTDYATHLVGATCTEFNEGSEHRIDLSVWTREKQPAMYTRSKLRNYLLEKDHNIEQMEKSTLVDCWGEDKQ